jgi:MYXO-CTERM domain-containing protein
VFGDAFEALGSSTTAWSGFVADLVGDGLVAQGIAREEVQGLASGALVLGEVSGPSDGLVFVDSATDAGALTARGATIVDAAVKNLSHIDLLYASPITGQLLIDAADDAPANAWMAAVGQRYTREDSLGWIEAALAEDEIPETGDTGSNADDTGGVESGAPSDALADAGKGGAWGGCEGCSGTGEDPAPSGALLLGIAALLGVRRRQSSRGRAAG